MSELNGEDGEIDENDPVPEDFGHYNYDDNNSEGEKEYGNDFYDNLFDSDQQIFTSDYDPAITPTSISLSDHEKLATYIQAIDENKMFDCMIKDTADTYNNSLNINLDEDSSEFNQKMFLTRTKIHNKDEMLKWLESKSSNNAKVITPTTSWIQLDSDTRVELVTNSLELKNRTFRNPTVMITSTLEKERPTISEVSILFNLSAKQHAFFSTIALILLRTWNDRELDTANDLETIMKFLKSQQKLIYLTGEGGTGKSRCIEALQHFCNQWGRPDVIAKTALTGKAAAGVEGIKYIYTSIYININ